jgi:hypothetical protein
MSFNFWVPLLSGILGVLLAAAIDRTLGRIDARRKLRAADEQRFQSALNSDSLDELGHYLDDVIGNFSTSQYAENPKVRTRVNSFVARLEDFVGKPQDIPPEPAMPPHVEVVQDIDPTLQDVQRRIERGAIWDGLALLRRTIEANLRLIAHRNAVEVPERIGAGRMLSLLRQRQVIPEDVERNLRYAIDVANRGVHGLEVSPGEASEAVQEASNAFSKLKFVH